MNFTVFELKILRAKFQYGDLDKRKYGGLPMPNYENADAG
jgi:hypothetical protein